MLVFPFLLFLTLLMIQAAVVLAANVVLQRAAHATARVAVVQVPRDLAGEPVNVVTPQDGWAKYEAIREAAWFAVLPVSGRERGSGLVDGNAIASAVGSYFDGLNASTPVWVQNFVAARAAYAAEHTEVDLLEATANGGWRVVDGAVEFGPQDAIGVRVRHRLNLGVPYARFFFATARHTTADGPGAYALVSATAALPNQGIDVRLPERPPVPLIEPGEDPMRVLP